MFLLLADKFYNSFLKTYMEGWVTKRRFPNHRMPKLRKDKTSNWKEMKFSWKNVFQKDK